jgi:hypothetical protein
VPEHVCAEAPHRQFVLTIPKPARIYFRFERGYWASFAGRPRATVITVYGSASRRPDAVPRVAGATMKAKKAENGGWTIRRRTTKTTAALSDIL